MANSKTEYIAAHRKPDVWTGGKSREVSTAEVEAIISMVLTAGNEGFNKFVLYPVRDGASYYVTFYKETEK